jgi:hypothetical protein
MPILTHMLRYRADDAEIAFDARVYAPVDGEHDHGCRYEIDWPDRPFVFEAKWKYALDALRMAGIQIYTSQYHAEARLRAYDGPDDGYGFPTPHTIRDVLIGLDALTAGTVELDDLHTPEGRRRR